MYTAPPVVPPTGPQPHAERYPERTRWRWVVAIAAALIAGGVAGGIAGVIAGAHTTRPAVPATARPAPAPAPNGEIRAAATVDLCTAYAVGTRAMPIPQTNAIDVLPVINYINAALAADQAADPEIRAAVAADLALTRRQAGALTHEAPAGAIQPGTGWTADASNDSEETVFKLCRAYTG
jgi:hypothetical protein